MRSTKKEPWRAEQVLERPEGSVSLFQRTVSRLLLSARRSSRATVRTYLTERSRTRFMIGRGGSRIVTASAKLSLSHIDSVLSNAQPPTIEPPAGTDTADLGGNVMRICRFGDGRVGLVRGELVHDVTAALDGLGRHAYPLPTHDLMIAALDELMPRMEAIADDAPGAALAGPDAASSPRQPRQDRRRSGQLHQASRGGP